MRVVVSAKLCFLLAFLKVTDCHKEFQNVIPNGNNVPNPCTEDPTDTWGRVGHSILQQDQDPDHVKNPFGKDFLALYKTKTKVEIWPILCEYDSDKDGMLNKDELGDPNCKWRMDNNEVVQTTGLSHPGIPEQNNEQKTVIDPNIHCV